MDLEEGDDTAGDVRIGQKGKTLQKHTQHEKVTQTTASSPQH